MTRPMRRLLICGAVALAGGPLPSPLAASNAVAPAPASVCVAPAAATADVMASHQKCARERKRKKRMCRRYGIISSQCLNAFIELAICEGRWVDSYAVTAPMAAGRDTGLVRFLDEGAHGFRYGRG